MNVLCSSLSARRRKPKTLEVAPPAEEQNIFPDNTVIHNGLRAKVREVDWPARKVDLSYFRAGESQPPPRYGVPISEVQAVPEKVIVKAPGAMLQSW